MSYAVGQVVFLLLQKELKVIPAMIVEQTVTRTLEGEKTAFSVIVPASSKNGQNKKYPLDKLDAKVYTTVDQVRSDMIRNATGKINNILNASITLAKENFDYNPEAPESADDEIPIVKEPEPAPQKPDAHDGEDVISDIMSLSDSAEIDLGNGIKAKINPKNITLT